MTRKWIAMVAALLFSVWGASPAWAGTWRYQAPGQPGPGAAAGGWQYLQDDGALALKGWIKDQGKWYYIGDDGFMTTGWIELDGNWYYLDESGAMASGTTRVIDGTEYSFDENGVMKDEAGRAAAADGWDGTTFTSARLNYQVTVPEGFVPLQSFMDLYVNDTMTLDMSAAAPDMTVSVTVVTFDRPDDGFRGMDAGRLAAAIGQGMGESDGCIQVGKAETVVLGNSEYAKLPVVYTGIVNQDLYFRWAGDCVMMIEIVYDPDREEMAEGIIRSIR